MTPQDDFPEHSFVARVGIALLVQPAHSSTEQEPAANREESYEKVVEALGRDTRVRDFPTVSTDDNIVREFVVAGPDRREGSDRVEAPRLHVHVARFERPLVFQISVARRFQPSDQGEFAVPAEDYWVAWDGVQVMVMWRRPDAEYSNTYGGISALEVLEDAVRAAGRKLFVEPCGPNCDFPFAHRDVYIVESEDGSQQEVEPIHETAVRIVVPTEKKPMAIVRRVAVRLSFSTRLFAKMRRFGSAVLSTDRRAKTELEDLLRLHYLAADARTRGARAWAQSLFQASARGREIARLTAALWLRLVTIDSNKRGWAAAKDQYDASSQKGGRHHVFGYEYPQEVSRVSNIDTGDLRGSVQGMTARADSRSVAIATASGAIAGGLVGALISVVASIVSATS